MKKLLLLILFATSLRAAAQCTAPVLTPIGVVGETWEYSCATTPLSLNPTVMPNLFEWCYLNPGASDTVVFPTQAVMAPISGFTGTATTGVWYLGIQAGAQFWIKEYCIHGQSFNDVYSAAFLAFYSSKKADTAHWVKSNVLTVAALPGSPSPARGKKK